VALARNGGVPNARLEGRALDAVSGANRTVVDLLAALGEQGAMSARGMHRVLRIARTIADLAGRGEVAGEDVAAAAALRNDVAAQALAA
jgi:magnesium chelatase family protein